MNREVKQLKIYTHPWWMRAVALVLIPIELLSTIPVVGVACASDAPAMDIPAPVLTPKNVTVNRSLVPLPAPVLTPHFSAAPTDGEFFTFRGFCASLRPVAGQTTVDENKDLANTLASYLQASSRDREGIVAGYLARHPQSAWRASLLDGLGTLYRRAGFYSKAIAAWEEVWQLIRNQSAPETRTMADKVCGDLAQLYAWSGNTDKLQALLAQVGNRQFTGVATEKMAYARQTLDEMQVAPETAFKCGAYALSEILGVSLCDPSVQGRTLARVQATPQGMSLSQVLALSREVGLNYQMAKRSPGAAVLLPCIVHWNLGHYSALRRVEGGRYLIQDNGLGIGEEGQTWVSKAALDAETSGYCLVPAGKLPAGWQPVSPADGDQVWGRSYSTGSESRNTRKNSKTCTDCPKPPGMPVYNVHAMLVSLTIEDTPVGYAPPVGPAVSFTLTYNQREAYQLDQTVYNYSNLGPKWGHNWLAFITVTDQNPSLGATICEAGGGASLLTGYSSSTLTFAPVREDRSVVTVISSSCYSRAYPDGSVDLYSLPDTASTTGPCHLYLTKRTDPLGNSVTLNYDSDFRLAYIEDAAKDPVTKIGQQTSFSYELSTVKTQPGYYKITKVTDPFLRCAKFQYDAQLRLCAITDVMGMTSSFTYDGTGDFIKAMTTPYGTTTFQKTEGPLTTRAMEVTDPLGRRERTEFRSRAPGILGSDTTFPGYLTDALRNSYLDARNTFYWDKHQMEVAAGDYTQAKVFHWWENSQITLGILQSEKTPLGARVWYSYPGQTSPWNWTDGTNMVAQPSLVARVIGTDSHGPINQVQQYSYNSQGRVAQAVDPVGRTTIFNYAPNQMDLLQVQQLEKGASTNAVTTAQFVYNAAHQPLQITDASGQTTFLTYNAQGQLATVKNALNQTTTYNHDAKGYLTSVTGPDGATLSSYTYDGFGRVNTVTDSQGYQVSINYDNLNRPTLMTFPDGTYTQTVYDKLDAVRQRDRLGRWNRLYYNAVRQLIASEDPARRITNFTWCGCGSMDSLTDPAGNTTRWIRDIEGRVTSKVYPDRTALTYIYESGTGWLQSVKDAGGRITSYSYNIDNTLNQVSYSGGQSATPSVSYTYDPNYNRIQSMTDGTGTTVYAYNAIGSGLGSGRMAGMSVPVNANVFASFGYAYDALGRATNTTIDGVSSADVFLSVKSGG